MVKEELRKRDWCTSSLVITYNIAFPTTLDDSVPIILSLLLPLVSSNVGKLYHQHAYRWAGGILWCIVICSLKLQLKIYRRHQSKNFMERGYVMEEFLS